MDALASSNKWIFSNEQYFRSYVLCRTVIISLSAGSGLLVFFDLVPERYNDLFSLIPLAGILTILGVEQIFKPAFFSLEVTDSEHLRIGLYVPNLRFFFWFRKSLVSYSLIRPEEQLNFSTNRKRFGLDQLLIQIFNQKGRRVEEINFSWGNSKILKSLQTIADRHNRQVVAT